jgi:hypothetical protein
MLIPLKFMLVINNFPKILLEVSTQTENKQTKKKCIIYVSFELIWGKKIVGKSEKHITSFEKYDNVYVFH